MTATDSAEVQTARLPTDYIGGTCEGRPASPELTRKHLEENGNTMRRAIFGYSTSIGYDYEYPDANDDQGRLKQANPVVVGSMGLMLLYDETWFAEEWLCPLSMRPLPYCRFHVFHSVPSQVKL